MIGLIDYGMGNLPSVSKALENMGFTVTVSDDPKQLENATGLILPGVGAFGEAMQNLRRRGFDTLVREHIGQNKPFLGICLGLQLLFPSSEESPGIEGLGILPGKVVKFPVPCYDENGARLKVPHMGWNSVHFISESLFTRGIPNGSYYYFVHSYYVETVPDITAATTDYGSDITVAVSQGNLFACQFHPEKSQQSGLQIIKNFGEICENYSGN